jgi:hypothetical protein
MIRALSLAAALALLPLSAALAQTPDFREGFAAFQQKRTPAFTGRTRRNAATPGRATAQAAPDLARH